MSNRLGMGVVECREWCRGRVEEAEEKRKIMGSWPCGSKEREKMEKKN